MSLGIKDAMSPHQEPVLPSHGRSESGWKDEVTLLESVCHGEKEGQWSRSPAKVRQPEGVQLCVLWQKQKLTTGEGQYPRDQEIVKQMKIREDVSVDISMSKECGVHMFKKILLYSVNQSGTHEG